MHPTNCPVSHNRPGPDDIHVQNLNALPVVLPSDPGITFTPPPSVGQVGEDEPREAKANSSDAKKLDCEVR